MMENVILAPIQVERLYLVDSSFHIEDAPAKDMDQRLGLDIEAKQLEVNDGEGLVAINLTVNASLVDNENDEEKMRAGTVVFISASASIPEEFSDAEAKEYLLSNAVSMAYAHAKSCLMGITGLSPMGVMTLPAILPSVIAHNYPQEDRRPNQTHSSIPA